jgi:glycosyltransferase involved in cell wall biosynthesis
LTWFVERAFPLILKQHPQTRLIVIGSDPPPKHSLPALSNIELQGFVEDVREPLGRYALFVCPILSGSGVRVKLLEAFAAGIPVVSTRLGAEGLARQDGDICALADTPEDFAAHAVELLRSPDKAMKMAERARRQVVDHWDMTTLTVRLERSYRELVAAMRREG